MDDVTKAVRDNRSAIRAAGQTARSALLAAPGAPHKVAGRPTTVVVRNVSDDAVSARWVGPAHLVNNPTRAHEITPRGFVGTRSVGRKAQRGAALLSFFGVDARKAQGALKLSDGQFRSEVHHPGTHGKHFFEKGRDMAVPRASKTFAQEKTKQVGKAFTHG